SRPTLFPYTTLFRSRITTYAIQSVERLPVEATMMLIAGAIDFVVFVEKRNDFAAGGRLRRFVSSVREINGVDGRVLSSEIFAPRSEEHTSELQSREN